LYRKKRADRGRSTTMKGGRASKVLEKKRVGPEGGEEATELYFPVKRKGKHGYMEQDDKNKEIHREIIERRREGDCHVERGGEQ